MLLTIGIVLLVLAVLGFVFHLLVAAAPTLLIIGLVLLIVHVFKKRKV